jgi:hypothetical protein
MTTITELRQITENTRRKDEIHQWDIYDLKNDYDVEILDIIDIITKAYLCGDEVGREVADNRRKRIAERLQKRASI